MNTKAVIQSGAMILKLIKVLEGHTLTGLSNGEIAKALNVSTTNANRYVNTLISEGFAIKLANNRFALSTSLLHIAQTTANELLQARNRIDELHQQIFTGSL